VRFADRLAIVNEVHQALAASITLEELLDLILDRAFEHLQPEHGAIFLRREADKFDRVAGRSVAGATGELAYSESLIEEVAHKEMAALVLDAQTDQRFVGAESMLNAGVRSLIAAPLLDPAGALGFMVLSSNALVRQFTEDDLDLLITLASVAAMRIRNVALAEEAAERRRLEWELKQARRIQVGLFPDTLPEVQGYELFAGSIGAGRRRRVRAAGGGRGRQGDGGVAAHRLSGCPGVGAHRGRDGPPRGLSPDLGKVLPPDARQSIRDRFSGGARA